MKRKLITILKLVIVMFLIILLIKALALKGLSNIKITDDYLFLKLFSNSNKNKEEIKFKIDYKNIDFKSIDLSKTIDKNTLIYRKIAPGTRGSFNILLDSNKDLKYKIQFYSINEKPKNLKFEALKNEKVVGQSKNLEELSDKLAGNINENEKIYITIKWYWNFENNNEETDKQDTQDSENIRTYKFNIVTYGEERI